MFVNFNMYRILIFILFLSSIYSQGNEVLGAKFKDNRIWVTVFTEDSIKIKFYTDTFGPYDCINEKTLSKLTSQIHTISSDNKIHDDLIKEGFNRYIIFPQLSNGYYFPDIKLVDELNLSIPTAKGNEIFICPDEIYYKENQLGKHWFYNRIWTFDYINKKLIFHNESIDNTIIDSTHIVNIRFSGNSPLIPVKIDGIEYEFLFDTGAMVGLTDYALKILDNGLGNWRGTSFLRASIFNELRDAHPEWKYIENANSYSKNALLVVESIEIAGYTVGPVEFLRQEFTRLNWSGGAIGGSAFQYFTITLDYPNKYILFTK